MDLRNSFQRLAYLTLLVLVSNLNPADSKESSLNAHQYKEQTGSLPNFHEVHPYLFRGGQPSFQGLSQLKEKGIHTIIDLRGNPQEVNAEARQAKDLGFKTINLPMSSQPPTSKQVKTFLDTVSKAETGSLGPVFVHCAHGSDRTGCLVGIWRVTHDGYSYPQAYAEMRKYYFSPKFTRLSGSVKEYAQTQSTSIAQPAAR